MARGGHLDGLECGFQDKNRGGPSVGSQPSHPHRRGDAGGGRCRAGIPVPGGGTLRLTDGTGNGSGDDVIPRPLVIVLAGPNGAGKSTAAAHLLPKEMTFI